MWIRPFCLRLLLSPVWFLAYGIVGTQSDRPGSFGP